MQQLQADFIEAAVAVTGHVRPVDLVGLRRSPRIAKLVEKQLWRAHAGTHYRRWPRAGPLSVVPGLLAASAALRWPRRWGRP